MRKTCKVNRFHIEMIISGTHIKSAKHNEMTYKGQTATPSLVIIITKNTWLVSKDIACFFEIFCVTISAANFSGAFLLLVGTYEFYKAL